MQSDTDSNPNSNEPAGPTDLSQQAVGGGRKGGLVALIARQKVRLQNLSALVVLNFAAQGLMFVTSVKFANVLGAGGYGYLRYALVVGMYFGTVVRFGSDRALVKELVHFADRLPQMVLASIVLRGAILVCVVLALAAYQLAGGQWLAMPWAGVTIVGCMALSGMSISPVYDVWSKMGWHALLMLIQKLIYAGIAWTAILLGWLSLEWIAVAYVLSTVIWFVMEYRWAIKRMTFSGPMQIWRHVKHLVGAGWLFWLASVAMLCYLSLPRILLKREHGTEALGKYEAAFALALIAGMIVQQIARIGRPAAARATLPGVPVARQVRFLLAYMAVMLAVAATFSVPAILFPRAIIDLLFIDEYLEAAPAMRILAIYIFALVVGIVASQYVISKHMQKTYFTSVMIGGAISVAVCWSMIPQYGAVGAAVALLAGHGTAMMLYVTATVWVLRKQSLQRSAAAPVEVEEAETDALLRPEE